MSETRDIDIHVPVLARVEGEGALHLRIENGAITDLRLRIYEPPRLFEKLLVGRDWHEVPDIVARICGICPVAYQMSAVHALERILGIEPGPWVRAMRRVLYCGEWIESHSLHVHLLAAPDFLGYPGVKEMARDWPAEVRRGLRLQAAGNEIICTFGGRSVHPVGVRVGGFHHAPDRARIDALLARLHAVRPDAAALVGWCAALDLPAGEGDFTSFALRAPDEYPMNEGRLCSSAGHDFDSSEFPVHVREFQTPHSTALHAHLDGRPYLCGPLARLNLNHDRLPAALRSMIEQAGMRLPDRNMFHSITARAIEILYAVDEAIRLLEDYAPSAQPFVPARPRAGAATAATEAPRGVLWHSYALDGSGRVTAAQIVPPTSQNQARIEEDLRESLVRDGFDRPDGELRLRAEKIIRNYDPCISCATHFLKLTVERA
jgi:sulfhydrogenase subunit alpha